MSGGFAPGKRLRRLTLGTYPALTLLSARRKAQRALRELTTQDIDPAVGKREARRAQSFGELADDYLERHAKSKKKSWKEDQRMLGKDVLPHWQSRLVKTLTRRDVHDLLDRITDRGAPVTYNRVKALVSRIFKYGIDRGWLDHNPAAGILKQPETPRERVLSDEELTGLWRVLEVIRTGNQLALPIFPMMARGLQLMLRTGQRGGEVFGMRWDDVDEASGWWTIPKTQTKNGKPHRVPLTTAVLALLTEARADGSGPDGWVFAAYRGGSNRYQAANVISRLRHAGLLTGDYTRHDLRRTVATGITTLGIPRATLSHVLNHTDTGPRATAIYDRSSYDNEKQKALETWGRHLDTLVGGATPSRLVSFPDRRR